MVRKDKSFDRNEDDNCDDVQPLTSSTITDQSVVQNTLRQRQQEWAFLDPLSPVFFTIITIITFALAITYLVDFEDNNTNSISHIIHKLPWFRSSPKSYNYKHEPRNHYGIFLLGAPSSRNSLLTAYLSKSGYRVLSENEKGFLDDILIPFSNSRSIRNAPPDSDIMNPTSTNLHEPLMRSDALLENQILLKSQNREWKDTDIVSINSTEISERIHKHLFLKGSAILPFWENSGDTETHHPWIWHDPQLCLTFPAWSKIYHNMVFSQSAADLESNMDKKLGMIFSYRHPMEVAQSLHYEYSSKEDFMSISKGLKLWISYNSKCLENIHMFQEKYSLCVITVSEMEIDKDAQNSINSLLDKLDETCAISPSIPGRLGRFSQKSSRKKMMQYEKQVLEKFQKNHQKSSERSRDVILDALGVDDPLKNCSDIHGSKFDATEKELYEWGSEGLTNAMKELTSLQLYSRGEERKSILDEKQRLSSELIYEIEKWIGTDLDSIRLLLDVEQESSLNMNRTQIRTKRSELMSEIQREIQTITESALQVYCDLQNGIATKPNYQWPTSLDSSIRIRIP